MRGAGGTPEMGHRDQSENGGIPPLTVESAPVTPLDECKPTPAILDLMSNINCGKTKCWPGEAHYMKAKQVQSLDEAGVKHKNCIIHQDTEWVVVLLKHTPTGAKSSKH